MRGVPTGAAGSRRAAGHAGGGLGYALVVLLTVLVVVRPEEVYPEVGALRPYLLVTTLALGWNGRAVLAELTWRRLGRHPLLFVVLGLQGAVVASHLAALRPGRAIDEGVDFAKLVAYYLVVVAAVTTPARLRWFLVALACAIGVQTTFGVAQYYGYVNIEALKQVEERQLVAEDEKASTISRLCGSGIFHDPNDLALLLCAGMLVCIDRVLAPTGFARVLWFPLLGYLGFALTLTQSRGGLLAAGAGALAYVTARYGTRCGLAVAAVAAPIAMGMSGARQTRFDLSGENTGQDRIRLWSDGFQLVPSHPVFGIGAGEYADHMGLVAHNSYVHAFVELGLPGGSLFLAGFVLAVHAVAVIRPGPHLAPRAAGELRRFRLLVLGLLASCMAGMFSLSRDYVIPTYLILALTSVYVRLASRGGSAARFVVDGRLLVRVAVIGALGFLFLKLFIAVMVRYD